MKLYLFLDIDGVLNHEPETKDCGDSLRRFAGPEPNGFQLLCPACVKRLNELISFAYAQRLYSDVVVVCSSTWRRYFEPHELDFKLAQAGFDFTLSHRTRIDDKKRGDQIQDWLQLHAHEDYRYLVLDDDTHDMDLVKDNQVVTDFKTGFDNDAWYRASRLILDLL